jgi:hypothetical protein
MEVAQTYIEVGVLCHRERGFDMNTHPPPGGQGRRGRLRRSWRRRIEEGS